MRNKIIIAIISVTAVFFGANMASAASAPAPADCALTAADVAQIAAVQNNPTLTYLEEVKQELAVRKSLIAKIIACAQGQADALQGELANAQVPADATALKSQLIDKLSDADNFYGIESGKLDQAGIAGTQAIAKELLAWRASSYAPLAGEVNNFILWSENQALFVTAANRMDETRRAVTFLESISNDSDLEASLGDAESSFAAAQAKNMEAKTALAEFLPPDQSLATIKESLGLLSDTYQKFSNVSDLIKKVLPQ